MSGEGGIELSSQSQVCLQKLERRIEKPPLLSRKKKIEARRAFPGAPKDAGEESPNYRGRIVWKNKERRGRLD
ncbi:hypothetical protein SUGI_0880200 [Cryptomeria japonica]|nr:hypothetical protein SUGI_0880200 [Cryptomeria japonica]